MGFFSSVGNAISHAVSNPVNQLIHSTKKIVTDPKHANVGDLVSFANPVGAAAVSDYKHPQDAAVQLAAAGLAFGGAAAYSSLTAPSLTAGGSLTGGGYVGTGAYSPLGLGYTGGAPSLAGGSLPTLSSGGGFFSGLGSAVNAGVNGVGNIIGAAAKALPGVAALASVLQRPVASFFGGGGSTGGGGAYQGEGRAGGASPILAGFAGPGTSLGSMSVGEALLYVVLPAGALLFLAAKWWRHRRRK